MKKELERLGFKLIDDSEIILYKKYDITIEKIFSGYLINKPYRKFKTVNELRKIIEYGV
jgi:hypothetical protein